MNAFASTPRRRESWIAALAPAVILAWGWPRRWIALLTGAFGALAMPPFGFVPALAVSLVAALWLIDGAANSDARARTARASLIAAFGAGWWWGFGYFLAGLWWLGAAFLVDAQQYAWAMPLGVVALPAGLALFPALGFTLARVVWPQGAARVLALAFGLGLAEFLRSVLFTGFPWNELGLAFGQHLILAEGAAWVGLHGLTLAVVLILAAPATLWGGRGWMRFAPTALALIALASLAGFGYARLREPAPAPVAGVKLRILNTEVNQGPEFTPERGGDVLSRYLTLSDSPGPRGRGVKDVTHLIWPESPFPFILTRDAAAMQRIADFLTDGAVLATGAARMDPATAGRPARYFNSILAFNRVGLLPARYDKRHLVPFGEYLPLERLLRRLGLMEFVRAPGGYQPGRGSNLLALPGAPEALAMVCYEAIFPSVLGGAREGAAARARWILNVTDDAWFGATPGPYQHFAQARLRSIEWGLPMARAANGGISAIVDAYGRIVASARQGGEGVVDGDLPGALAPTAQSRWGAGPATLALVVIFALCVWTRSRR